MVDLGYNREKLERIKVMAKLQDWLDTAKTEFNMSAKDAQRLRRISRQLLAYNMMACNERELTATESQIEWGLTREVKAICHRYNIPQSDGNSVGYEYPDPRSGSGLRFILPSGRSNSWGGYNL
jgi:hypothetical protein